MTAITTREYLSKWLHNCQSNVYENNTDLQHLTNSIGMSEIKLVETQKVLIVLKV